MNQISFPGLGLNFSINPIAIPYGNGGVHWYGIIIALGVILGYLYARREAKRLGEETENVTDLLLWGLPLSVIGARLYYVIFEWEQYQNDLLGIFRIWEGGLAIYGGVIVACITGWIFTKRRNLKMLRYFDFGSMSIMIGQIIGRWGNFVNQEAHGTATNLPWGMLLEGETVPVHPTFFYESAWNLVGFLILHLLRKKKPFDGSLFCGYLVWYGIGRAWIEGLRTDSLWLWNTGIRVSQALSVVLVIVGVSLFFYLKNKAKEEKAGE